MSNSIILSSCLFGSVYLMSKSLELINRSVLDNKKLPHELIIFNGLTFVVSSSIFVGSFTLLSLHYLKSLRV
jgi:uncharacterized membrane protein YgdD (TMEM256/DUF423 family)